MILSYLLLYKVLQAAKLYNYLLKQIFLELFSRHLNALAILFLQHPAVLLSPL